MLRGIAPAGGDDLPEDRYATLVALAHLSKTINGAEGDPAFAAAAETASTLLRTSRTIVFVKRSDELVPAGTAGPIEDDDLLLAAREIAERSLDSGSPVICPNVSAESSLCARKLARADIASVLCVPMRVGESNIGAVVAMSDFLRAFSPSDIELLHVVASQAALAAWRSEFSASSANAGSESQDDLIKLAQRKIQDLSLINQVSEAMSSTLELDALLDIALEQSMALVGADGGSLMLVNEDTKRLEIVVSRGLARKWIESTRQQIGVSIAGWVVEHGESVLVTNARMDPRFQMTGFRDEITSAASVPLKSKSTVIGVLNINTRQDRFFDERDLELLGTVANQMAVAIENARLYMRVNRRTKQLGSLLEISKTLTSTLNLDEVLRRLSDQICKLFQLDAFVLLLTDELSGRFRFGHGTGLKTRRRYAYYDLAAPLAAQVKRTGRRLLLRDVTSSATFCTEVARDEGLKAAMCLPLKNRGNLVGVAAGFWKEARVQPKSQRDIMTQLGELAGVAIHNARVYRQRDKIAEILGQRLVPSRVPEFEGIDIGQKFLPARDVGGDYYDFICTGPGRLGVVVADVAGSDVEAAEYTTMGKYVLRTCARDSASPAEALSRTNDLICEDTRAEMFISLFYGEIDIPRMELRFANAGCEPAILYKSRDNTASVIAADGILLGIRPGMPYEERRVQLEPGDILAVYTDGLTEAGVDSSRFGRDAVMNVVRASAHLSAQGVADRIHDTLLEFVHGRITDDVAIVVLKLTPPASRP